MEIKNSTQSLSFNVSEEKILISNGVNEAATKYLNIIIVKMLFHFPLSQHLSAIGHSFITKFAAKITKNVKTFYTFLCGFSLKLQRKINDHGASIVESHLVREFNPCKLKTDETYPHKRGLTCLFISDFLKCPLFFCTLTEMGKKQKFLFQLSSFE